VKAGRLGRKAGRGVYEYPEQKAADQLPSAVGSKN